MTDTVKSVQAKANESSVSLQWNLKTGDTYILIANTAQARMVLWHSGNGHDEQVWRIE